MVKLFIPIILIAVGVMSDVYIFHRYIGLNTVWRWIWWLPTVAIFGFIFYFVFFGKGMLVEYSSVNIFLLLVGLFCVTKFVFALLSIIPKVGTWLGLIGATCVVFMLLWGITFGFCQLRVRHVVYESASLPDAFNGFKIVQFSDAHVGTFRGVYRHLLKESVDTINALHPDLICFVGDIENFSPDELLPHRKALSSLHAKHGVLTIMGNHDYSTYVNVPPKERVAMVERTRNLQRSFGWTMLSNSNVSIKRTISDGEKVDTSEIVVVGEENWGRPPFPQYGDVSKALRGLTVKNKRVVSVGGKPIFTVMLSHDPTAWKAHILPVFRPDVTLAGHTHGTQFSLFGWSPASMIYKEWGGEYYDVDNGDVGRTSLGSLLNVSTGIGGNFPFRFCMPREVVLITLRKSVK